MARIYRDAWASRTCARPRSTISRTARDRSPRGTGPGSWSSCADARPAPPPRSSGPRGVPWDRLARRTGIADTARRAHARLTPETRAFVASYVAGVNDGLHADAPELEALGIEPARVGGVDPAGGLPRPAPALRQPARQALVRPRPRGARRRRRPALARGSAAQRQQRLGGRRRTDGERLPARRRATRTARSRAPASTSRSGSRATSSTSSASRSRASPASRTSPTRATSRGRSPTRWPTTRTCTPSGCGARAAGWRRWGPDGWEPASARGRVDPGARRTTRSRSRS